MAEPPKYPLTITICTDAGFSRQRALGVWAAYIRTPARRIKTSGLLKQAPRESTEAERMAIANALHIVARMVGLELKKHKLIIYCDSKNALAKPRVKVTENSRYHASQKARYDWYMLHIEPHLALFGQTEMRWVRGHLAESKWDDTSQRNWMNRWCDLQCRKLMREQASLAKPQHPNPIRGLEGIIKP